MKFLNQLEFSTLLFDTIFGLILFYSFDSLVGITSGALLVFYLFSMFVLVHWWLMFKSTDDSFREEVTDSAADIVFGIVYAIILYYMVQYSRLPNFKLATVYIIAIFAIDFLWSFIWRYVGSWRTSDAVRIKTMESILNKGMILDVIFGACFGLLLLERTHLSDMWFVGVYVALYSLFIGLTFRVKTLNIDIF